MVTDLLLCQMIEPIFIAMPSRSSLHSSIVSIGVVLVAIRELQTHVVVSSKAAVCVRHNKPSHVSAAVIAEYFLEGKEGTECKSAIEPRCRTIAVR